MFILFDFSIPKDHLNEIKGLSTNSIKGLLPVLINYVSYTYTKESCDCDGISMELNNWINSLTKSQVIKLSHYMLSILDYLTEEDN